MNTCEKGAVVHIAVIGAIERNDHIVAVPVAIVIQGNADIIYAAVAHNGWKVNAY